MGTQIETFNTIQRLAIGSYDSKELMQDIRREDYASRAFGLWPPWQTLFGTDYANANQLEEGMTDIYDDAINLKEEYQWLNCYIWLPEEYNVTDIDPDTILLNGKIRATCFEIKDELQLLIAKFSWSQVEGILELGEFEFTVSGELFNGAILDCSDTITVIDEEKEE